MFANLEVEQVMMSRPVAASSDVTMSTNTNVKKIYVCICIIFKATDMFEFELHKYNDISCFH